MFDAARLRLTGWYLLILSAIVGALSFVLYHLLIALQQSELRDVARGARTPLAHVFARDEVTLAYQIIAVDAAVIALAAAGAYVLAGRTLQPIAEVMERQRRFAGAASHELRTPLTVLQGSLEVALLNPRSREEYERVIRDAVAETERMGDLVKNLMVLARAESDIALTLVPVNLTDLVCAALEDTRVLARRKDQTLEVAIADALPVRADPVKLRQAIANLLENAVRYTPERGALYIAGKRERGNAVLEIRDTGVGISEAHLPYLFEPFYQVDTARGTAGHVGLGLALAAWIVRAHQGQIDVTSREGVGSVFTLSLPLAA